MILPPPMSTLMGVFITIGLVHLGWRMAVALGRERTRALDVAAGFIAVTAAVAAVVHGLALAQLSSAAALRPMGWALAVAGVSEVVFFGRRRSALLLEGLGQTWSEVGKIGRAGLGVSSLTVLALVAAGLGPPTDADSLAYHLAVPIDWLEHGGVHVQPGWLTMRLVGLGEGLNMLGLAAGTDILGACLQIAGLGAVVVAMVSVAQSAPARVLALLVVASAPVLLFLVPNQKPQLLPAAAVFVALIIFVTRRESLDRRSIWMAWTAIAFAVACKYSFVLTGAVVGLAGLLVSWRQRMVWPSLVAAACAFMLLVGPVWGRNAASYGDPLTPNLEALKSHPDPTVVAFGKYLRTYGVAPDSGGRLGAMMDALATVRPDRAALVLGVGALAFVAALPASGGVLILLICAAAAGLLIGVFGQISARFLLEPYLWAGAAAVASTRCQEGVRFRSIAGVLTVQTALVLAMATIGAVRLFPGAWTWRLRDQVMTVAAYGYAEGKWLDRAISPDAVVLNLSMRSQAFAHRRSIVYEGAGYAPEAALYNDLCEVVKTNHVTVAVVGEPVPTPALAQVLRDARPITDIQTFRVATRKPLSSGAPYQVRAYDVSLGCR